MKKLSVWTLALAGALTLGMQGPAFAKDEFKMLGKWNKLCPKSTNKKAPKICITQTNYIDKATGGLYSPVVLEDIDKVGKSLVVELRHILVRDKKVKDKKTKKDRMVREVLEAKWNIPSGVAVQIGDSKKKHKLGYKMCHRLACVAQVKATKEIIGELKKAKHITVLALMGTKVFPFRYSLDGFAKAMDGKPTDIKAYAGEVKKFRQIAIAQQKKYIAAMRKKAAAQKKK